MISVQGHRGARGILPENTLPAFAQAVQVGADFLELDIGVTRDGVLIITHDPFLNPRIQRWKNGKAIAPETAIHALSLEEIRGIDCGSLKNPEFPRQSICPGEGIPTLAELFESIAKLEHPNAKKIIFNIELKSVPAGDGWLQPKPKKFASLVLALVRKFQMRERVVLQSFDHRVLAEIRKLDKKIFLSALFSDNSLDYLLVAKRLGVQAISAHMHWITRADVLALQRKKIQVFVWTANEERDWQRLAKLGVDSIISDYPEELLRFLGSRKLH